MGETRAELPLTGDQVGPFKAQPGRPKVPWQTGRTQHLRGYSRTGAPENYAVGRVLRSSSIAFRCKDYRINGPGRYCTMTLAPDEFIRRFLVHVLLKAISSLRQHTNQFNNL